MTKKTGIDFKAIKERVTLGDLFNWYDIVENYVDDGKGGLKGPCPFKCESTIGTSFKVSADGRLWFQHDKACKCLPVNSVTKEVTKGGNILDFVMIKEAIGLVPAAKKVLELEALASQKSKGGSPQKTAEEHREVPEVDKIASAERKLPDRHQTFNERGLKPVTVDSKHAEVLSVHGLDDDTAEAFGIGYVSKGMMRGRVVFPIRNIDGELIAYGGVLSGEGGLNWTYPKDFFPELEVIGLDEARAKTAHSVTASHGLIVISFDLSEQAKVANALGSDFNLSIAILSERLSAQQKTALMTFHKEGFEGNFLIRVRSGNVPHVALDLLQFLAVLGFAKLSFFD